VAPGEIPGVRDVGVHSADALHHRLHIALASLKSKDMRRKAKDERADVTTDGQVSLSDGTLQRKPTGLRALGYARCGTFGERHRPNSRSPLVLMVENALS
jgi:hypothetical protein